MISSQMWHINKSLQGSRKAMILIRRATDTIWWNSAWIGRWLDGIKNS
jgi:hypothetical protein